MPSSKDDPEPPHQHSQAFWDRMADEARFDNEAFERFKAEHNGMTPLDVVALHDPVFGALYAIQQGQEAAFTLKYGLTPEQYIEKHDPTAAATLRERSRPGSET